MQLLFNLLICCHCSDEVIGIDFGSTSTCVSVFINGEVKVIKNEFGSSITSSMVSFHNQETFVGDIAKQQMISNPSNTLYGIKYFINNTNTANNYPFTVNNNNGHTNFEIAINNKKHQLSLEDTISRILQKMKNLADNSLGKNIRKAVIAVPSYFNENQCNIIKNAGEKAGFLVIKILKEPIAAALAYRLYEDNEDQNVLVYHLGGYSQEVSLLSIKNSIIKILNSESSTEVSGEMFNNKIIDYLLRCFNKKTGKDASKDLKALTKLKLEVEKAKQMLLLVPEVAITIDDFYDGQLFYEKITKENFENLNKDLFQKSLISIKSVLERSNITKDKVNKIVLVGGSTRIQKLQQIISNFFNGKQLLQKIKQEEVIAYGAAVEGACISNDKNAHEIIKRTPYSFGIKTDNDIKTMFIQEQSHLPIKVTKSFVLSYNEQSDSIYEIFMFPNDLSPSSISLSKINMSDFNFDQKRTVDIEITFELLKNYTLIVIIKTKNKKNTVTIDIDKVSLKQKITDQYDQEISQKIHNLKLSIKTTKKEINELQMNYMNKIKWLIIENSDNDDRFIKEKMNQLKNMLAKYFDEIFPDFSKRLQDCENELEIQKRIDLDDF